jgi:hypothetical protein
MRVEEPRQPRLNALVPLNMAACCVIRQQSRSNVATERDKLLDQARTGNGQLPCPLFCALVRAIRGVHCTLSVEAPTFDS